jgi:hypothetical protein
MHLPGGFLPRRVPLETGRRPPLRRAPARAPDPGGRGVGPGPAATHKRPRSRLQPPATPPTLHVSQPGPCRARSAHFPFRGRPRGLFGAGSLSVSAARFGGRPLPASGRSAGSCRNARQSTPSASARATAVAQDGSLRTGLRPDRARGKLKAVWLHTRARTDWAVRRVADRHGFEEEDIVVLEVILPRSAVRRNGRGIWTCKEAISPLRVVGINGLRVYAG